MIFEYYHINERLSKYIDSIFYQKGSIQEYNTEKVLPTGNLAILMEFDGFERQTLNEKLQRCGTYSKVSIWGVQSSPINVLTHKNIELLAIQFKPMGAYPFLQMDTHIYSNSVKSAELCFGDSIIQIYEHIGREISIDKKFKIIENWLSQKLDSRFELPKDVVSVLKNFVANPYVKHSILIDGYSKTQKHLIHQFKKYLGLTPKELHGIIRFNAIRELIYQKEKIQWTEIVYDMGFSDQPHFIKEFKKYSGFNPSTYFKIHQDRSVPFVLPLNS